MVYSSFRERERRLPTGMTVIAGRRATRQTGKIGKVPVELTKALLIVDEVLVAKKSTSTGAEKFVMNEYPGLAQRNSFIELPVLAADEVVVPAQGRDGERQLGLVQRGRER
jgi:hypothetical protein